MTHVTRSVWPRAHRPHPVLGCWFGEKDEYEDGGGWDQGLM